MLKIDLSQNPELRPSLSNLVSRDGWRLAFRATEENTGEQFVIQFEKDDEL